ncbi:DUF3817 domain-containing protein [Actinoplanes sp. NPDC051343]|uniref:DUF3817 domain-containing protein n=1 Tax=Actinoplanes sp. NPDC051343 TaxID=3363906 RepID=UPI003791242F
MRTVLLRIAARVEAASLVILLANLATVHIPWIATLVGPLHGCAYLLVIGTVLQTTRLRCARWLSLVPGIGGLLAERSIRPRARLSEH